MGCHMTYPMTCTTVWGPNQHAPCMAYTLQAQQTYMSYTLPDLHTFRVLLSNPERGSQRKQDQKGRP